MEFFLQIFAKKCLDLGLVLIRTVGQIQNINKQKCEK